MGKLYWCSMGTFHKNYFQPVIHLLEMGRLCADYSSLGSWRKFWNDISPVPHFPRSPHQDLVQISSYFQEKSHPLCLENKDESCMINPWLHRSMSAYMDWKNTHTSTKSKNCDTTWIMKIRTQVSSSCQWLAFHNKITCSMSVQQPQWQSQNAHTNS